jgi:hypothetical protein
MDFSTLADFRRKTDACFERAEDALMNAADALPTETPARSLAELSLSPFFQRNAQMRRGWPKLRAGGVDSYQGKRHLGVIVKYRLSLPVPNTRILP